MSVFHFSSVSGPLQKDGLKNKINKTHKLAHANKYRQLVATFRGQNFPMPYSYTNVRNPSGDLHWTYYSNCSYVYTNKQNGL